MGTIVLGAGVTGLAAGIGCNAPVYEARSLPGGICRSYFVRPGEPGRRDEPDDEAYRFEIGGGHWIFGGEPQVNALLRELAPLRLHRRRSAVFFADVRQTVAYPLQHHLGQLRPELGRQVLRELESASRGEGAAEARTLAEWLERSFGPTLLARFFGPFHESYTAGLWRKVAPEDTYKSPLALDRVRRGLHEDLEDDGYNAEFVYPVCGLDGLAGRMAERCDVRFGKRVVAIDAPGRRVRFADGSSTGFERAVCTLPLQAAVELAGVAPGRPDPHTSVLVLNVGATRGPACPDRHWLYVPDSRSGFFRVGFYSNVDEDFLPRSARGTGGRVSLYVERAFPGGRRPGADAIARYADAAVAELRGWGFIGDVEALDPTWVEVAYTWTRPGSSWRRRAIAALEAQGLHPAGRYGRWRFQGIARSIRDGLEIGAALRA